VKIIKENNVFRKREGQNEKCKFRTRKEFGESGIENKNTERKEGQRKRAVKQGKSSFK